MIHVPPTDPPEGFDTNCAARGAAWLEAYPDKDPRENAAWWQAFKPHLAEAFQHRCAYLAMFVTDGDVDHFLACGHRDGKPSPHRNRAFDWTNFRYADAATNSRKGTLDDKILDPFTVGEGWFVVDLYSFRIRYTDLIPESLREKARTTIEKLRLNEDFRLRQLRRRYYERYWLIQSQEAFAILALDAPLIAKAVQDLLDQGFSLPDPNLYPVANPNVRLRQRPYKPRPRKS